MPSGFRFSSLFDNIKPRVHICNILCRYAFFALKVLRSIPRSFLRINMDLIDQFFRWMKGLWWRNPRSSSCRPVTNENHISWTGWHQDGIADVSTSTRIEFQAMTFVEEHHFIPPSNHQSLCSSACFYTIQLSASEIYVNVISSIHSRIVKRTVVFGVKEGWI